MGTHTTKCALTAHGCGQIARETRPNTVEELRQRPIGFGSRWTLSEVLIAAHVFGTRNVNCKDDGYKIFNSCVRRLVNEDEVLT